MKKILLIVLIISIFLVSCAPDMQNLASDTADFPSEPSKVNEWTQISLTDVNTDTTFKVSDYQGKKVILESFAVWCPTCTRQQKILKDLHKEIGDQVISISIDTDPNEDANTVKQHAQSNGFDWSYVVAPKEFTQSLINQFGVGVVNAPSVPIILICEDHSTRMMPSGIKSVDKLKEEIAKGC
jgi:cytochrome oxidase Cu insertion factor (SCO1/SenC/PrrC family)